MTAVLNFSASDIEPKKKVTKLCCKENWSTSPDAYSIPVPGKIGATRVRTWVSGNHEFDREGLIKILSDNHYTIVPMQCLNFELVTMLEGMAWILGNLILIRDKYTLRHPL